MPATVEICTWCGNKYEVHQRKRSDARGSFCTTKCRIAFHDDYERKTGWLMIQVLKRLVNGKRLPRFKAPQYPGVDGYRKEWNRFATWVREVCQ